jgi:hypothetical protein
MEFLTCWGAVWRLTRVKLNDNFIFTNTSDGGCWRVGWIKIKSTLMRTTSVSWSPGRTLLKVGCGQSSGRSTIRVTWTQTGINLPTIWRFNLLQVIRWLLVVAVNGRGLVPSWFWAKFEMIVFSLLKINKNLFSILLLLLAWNSWIEMVIQGGRILSPVINSNRYKMIVRLWKCM